MHTGLNALHNFSFLTFSASGSTRVSNGTKLLFESKFKVMCCFLVTIKKSSKIWHFFTYFHLYFGHFKKFLNIGWKTAHGTLKFNFLEGFCFIWHPACPWERRAKVVEWRLKLLVKLYCLEWSWGPISPCTLCINDAKNSILNPPGPPIYTSTTLMSYAIDFLNSYKASWPIIFEYLPNRSTTAFCGKKNWILLTSRSIWVQQCSVQFKIHAY